MATQFEDLAQEVAKEAKVLCDFFNENGYYQPAFNQGGFNEFDELPAEIEVARKKLQAAAKAVHDLAAGPQAYVQSLSKSYHDTSTLRWLLNFKIPEAVPPHGSIAYSKLATTCNVNESHLRRILRYAMTNHLFREVDHEVAHTAYSAVLATDEDLRATLQYTTDELFPASAKLVEAHEKWMHRSERNRAAFQVAWSTDLPFREYFQQEGMEERRQVYDCAQEGMEDDMNHIITAYDWSLTRRLVCIGGADSVAAITLAKQFPNLRIMVEDLPELVERAQEELPDDLVHKIYFTAHDYTSSKPQPDEVEGADVYLLRDVLSHRSDEVAERILDGLLELLQEGGKLLIMDQIMPAAGDLTSEQEKEMRARDLDAMTMENGRERTLEDWKALLRKVDEDLSIRDVRQVEGSKLTVLEVVLDTKDE